MEGKAYVQAARANVGSHPENETMHRKYRILKILTKHLSEHQQKRIFWSSRKELKVKDIILSTSREIT